MYTFNIEKIESSLHVNDGTFLQTPFWCEFKSRHGWVYRRFKVNVLSEEDNPQITRISQIIDDKNNEIAVLSRAFCKGIFSIAYIPLAPKVFQSLTTSTSSSVESVDSVDENTSEESAKDYTIEIAHYIHDLAVALKPHLPTNTIAIRFDPDIIFDNPEDRDYFNFGMKTVCFADRLKLKKNKVDIQPPDSTLVDLTVDEEEILNRMHQKWRYNIRLSERKGVKITRYLGNVPNLSKKIDTFYALTKETNARDGNSSHAKSYYEDLIRSSAQEVDEGKDVPIISLYIAEHEGDEIASIMTLFSHDEAIYLYGASSNKKRNLMPNHLLQWTAMRDAKAYGSKVYDMYGMPPEGKDENHPMHGLYMFKANFGGRLIHRTGSWDFPTNFWYGPYNFAEKLRAFWFKKVIKKLKHR